MKESRLTLTEQLNNYDSGKYDSPDVITQIDAGWYDWFCQDKSLRSKTKNLYPKVKKLVKKLNLNTDLVYVFFKNNCPCQGSLYDDFRICSIEDRGVLLTVTPKDSHEDGRSSIWSRSNEFDSPISVSNNFSELLNDITDLDIIDKKYINNTTKPL